LPNEEVLTAISMASSCHPVSEISGLYHLKETRRVLEEFHI
jgi:hypothetical protein